MSLTFFTQVDILLGFLALALLVGLSGIRQVQQQSSTITVPIRVREKI